MSETPYQLFDLLTDEEYEALKADIRQRGVLVPVELDENGLILDGHHRVCAWNELKAEGVPLADYPRIIRPGLTEEQKRAHVRALNILRRHLTQDQRRAAIAAQLKETPERSNNTIAKELGVDDKTVGAVRRGLVSGSEIPNLSAVTGADGKTYPATRPEKSAGVRVRTPDDSGGEIPHLNEHDWTPEAIEEELSYHDIPFEPTPPRKMDVHYSSDTPEWYTPERLVKRVGAALGSIELDPASSELANEIVCAARYFTVDDDGLCQDWRAETLYMNPPYGDVIGAWVDKLVNEYEAGRIGTAIALVPARTDTAWFRRLRAYPRCFLSGRVKFVSPDGNDNSAPFPSAAVYLGRNVKCFADAFAGAGDIYTLWET